MRRRSVRLRLAGPVLALALTALAAASACGGGSQSEEGVPSGNGGQAQGAASASPTADKGRQFAQCLRDNGLPDFPDPDPDGNFDIDRSKLNESVVQKAMEACRTLMPDGMQNLMKDPDTVDKLRQIAQCLRDLGVDAQDPDPNNPVSMLNGLDRNDPKVQEAIETCQEKVNFRFGPGAGR